MTKEKVMSYIEGKGLEPIILNDDTALPYDKVAFLEGSYSSIIFKPGDPLEIIFDEKDLVIFSDCDVTVERHGPSRIFTIQNTKGTVYAHFVNGILTK